MADKNMEQVMEKAQVLIEHFHIYRDLTEKSSL